MQKQGTFTLIISNFNAVIDKDPELDFKRMATDFQNGNLLTQKLVDICKQECMSAPCIQLASAAILEVLVLLFLLSNVLNLL